MRDGKALKRHGTSYWLHSKTDWKWLCCSSIFFTSVSSRASVKYFSGFRSNASVSVPQFLQMFRMCYHSLPHVVHVDCVWSRSHNFKQIHTHTMQHAGIGFEHFCRDGCDKLLWLVASAIVNIKMHDSFSFFLFLVFSSSLSCSRVPQLCFSSLRHAYRSQF